MKWEDYQPGFEFDGSWRDIYALDTSISDWQVFVDLLRSGVYKYTYTIEGKETLLPSSIGDVFESRGRSRPLLEVKVGSAILNCHFFGEQQIELDLDPRQIANAIQAEQLFEFMGYLGRLLNKDILLTPENMQEVPIFRFSSLSGQIQYIPCEM